MRRGSVILAIFAIAASGPHRSPPSNATVIAAAKGEVIKKLRDPGSAQFRNLRVITVGNGYKAVCGEVNSRNGFGGYAGFQGFVYEAALNDARINDESDPLYATFAKPCLQ